MKENIRVTARTALATTVAGAVLLFAGCGPEPADSPGAKMPPPAETAIPDAGTAPKAVSKAASARQADAPTAGLASQEKKIPDALMRLLVDEAVNANDYGKLSALAGKLDRIADPDIRLRLLEGLAWFEETALADALPFLLDADERVAAAASEVVTSGISSVARQPQRERLYVAALKLMPDSADRDILIATLEGDRKSVCLHVLRDLEPMRKTRPGLWRKLTDVYKAQFGRPYVSHVEALLHYNPRED